jgi:hypothetical protein
MRYNLAEMDHKTLVVMNPGPDEFHGVGKLLASFKTSAIRPVAVYSPEGAVVPSRLVGELQTPLEDEGRIFWAFILEFFCDAPARALVKYRASFADEPGSQIGEDEWEARHAGGALLAIEQDGS